MANKTYIQFPSGPFNPAAIILQADPVTGQLTATIIPDIPTLLSQLTNDTGYITSAALASLTDVQLTSLSNGQVMQYDAATGKWKNVTNPAAGWSLTGNAGINSATNFIGTTDAQALAIRTNNVQRMFLDAAGLMNLGGSAVISVPSWASAFGVRTIFQSPVLMRASDTATKGLVFGTDQETFVIRARKDTVYDVDLIKVDATTNRIVFGLGLSLSGTTVNDGMLVGKGLSSDSNASAATAIPAGALGLQSAGSGNAFINFTGNTAGFFWAMGTGATTWDFRLMKNPSNRNTFDGTEVLRVVRSSSNVLIGTSTDQASALLNVSSTTKGFLPPRMTTAQRTAIVSPAEGLMVYDTDIKKLFCFTTTWEQLH